MCRRADVKVVATVVPWCSWQKPYDIALLELSEGRQCSVRTTVGAVKTGESVEVTASGFDMLHNGIPTKVSLVN